MRLLKNPSTHSDHWSQVEAVEGPPHPVRVEVGVVAEEHAHRHHREGDREAEEDGEDEDPQHEQGDLGVGQSTILRTSSPCWAASISTSSVSRTSSSGSSHSPERMQRMQRMTWAMPWMKSRRPAATITDLSW